MNRKEIIDRSRLLEKTIERTKPLKENRTWISSEPSGQSLSLHLFYPSLLHCYVNTLIYTTIQYDR